MKKHNLFIVPYAAIGSTSGHLSVRSRSRRLDTRSFQPRHYNGDVQPSLPAWLPLRGRGVGAIFLLLFWYAMMPAVAKADAPPTPSQFTEAEIRIFIDAHNAERNAVGAPPVEWDQDIAAYAQDYANQLAMTGKFEHMDRDQRKKLDQGENLHWTSKADRNYETRRCTESWASEKVNPKTGQSVYVRGLTYDEIKEQNPGHVLGHYTQVIWRTSTRVGAGIAEIRTGPKKGGYVVVARYTPRGNRGSRVP